MPWIDTIDIDDADGPLADLYDRITDERGKVANILKVHSLNPEALRTHLDLYEAVVYGDNGLSREQRELIATAVSIVNDCEYCTQHHAMALNAYWRDDERTERFVDDVESVDLSTTDRALVDYAEALTESPADVGPDDIDALREVGLDDEQILAAALVIGYFNFVNRLASGLGVDYSPEEMTGYDY